MKEIRWHGRGGNGGFTAARLLGSAAALHSGKYGQAFPSFGPERRGAPVLGFTRISDEPITDHSQVYECDCVIVLDATLMDAVNVLDGLKEDGCLVINTAEPEEVIRKRPGFDAVKNLVLLDGTSLALKELGTDIVNTVMLGAAIGATDLVTLDAINAAVDDTMSPALREKNKKVIKMAYDAVKEG
ncbi:MAG: 2-oxoacid:acceptor oxidoreductase family protein [Eubacterium sp.]|nr:2-oxoacid:acceptor oxidoreductase family protein [Eubacterium sp.]